MMHTIEPARPLASEGRGEAGRTRHAHCAGLFLVTLALSACAPRPAAPIYCVSPQQLQKLKDAEPPKIGGQLNGNAQDDLKLIAGNNVELRAYGHGLLGVIEGCVGS